jgi:hypothetical protein
MQADARAGVRGSAPKRARRVDHPLAKASVVPDLAALPPEVGWCGPAGRGEPGAPGEPCFRCTKTAGCSRWSHLRLALARSSPRESNTADAVLLALTLPGEDRPRGLGELPPDTIDGRALGETLPPADRAARPQPSAGRSRRPRPTPRSRGNPHRLRRTTATLRRTQPSTWLMTPVTPGVHRDCPASTRFAGPQF